MGTKTADSKRSWRQEADTVYFSVTSDGTTGEGWISRLEKQGFPVGVFAEQVLRSSDFKPTTGVTTNIAVLKGLLFEDGKRINVKVRKEAEKRELVAPNAEIACLVREKFSDEEIEAMGLASIMVMHEPIRDFNRYPCVLTASRSSGGRWFGVEYTWPGPMSNYEWNRDSGFAFAISKAST